MRLFTKTRIAILAGMYLALSAIGGIALVEISLRPPTLRPINDAAVQRAREVAAQHSATLEPIEHRAADGTQLHAWLLRPAPERSNGAGVLLLHGVSDSRIGTLGLAPFLLHAGYTLLLPDARAHGQSTGLATYGLIERHDVRAWAALLKSRITTPPAADTHSSSAPKAAIATSATTATLHSPTELSFRRADVAQQHPRKESAGHSLASAPANAAASPPRTGCIYAIGASMGAAMTLQSLGASDGTFCAVVVDSPFSDFKEVAFDRTAQAFALNHWFGRTALRPLVEFAFLYARAKYSLDLAAAAPVRAAQSSSVPILLIHGEADTNIPIRHAHALKSAQPRIEFWPVPNVTHTAAHGADPAQYERRVLHWFAQHASPQRTTAPQ